MALIKCPECGSDVSDKAKACIKCGFPLGEYNKENAEKENASREEEKQKAIEAEKAKYWCRHCYRQNEIGRDYCAFCGERLTPQYTRENLLINNPNVSFADPIPQKKCCPKCGSRNHHAFVETVVVEQAKVKSTTTLNLNPFKPFTKYNHKEKVIRPEITKQVSKFVCDDCGHIFQ